MIIPNMWKIGKCSKPPTSCWMGFLWASEFFQGMRLHGASPWFGPMISTLGDICESRRPKEESWSFAKLMIISRAISRIKSILGFASHRIVFFLEQNLFPKSRNKYRECDSKWFPQVCKPGIAGCKLPEFVFQPMKKQQRYLQWHRFTHTQFW